MILLDDNVVIEVKLGGGGELVDFIVVVGLIVVVICVYVDIY